MSEEVEHLQDAADGFSFDLLVEAVAFSQGKYDFSKEDIRTELRDAAKLQEVSHCVPQLHCKRVEKESVLNVCTVLKIPYDPADMLNYGFRC